MSYCNKHGEQLVPDDLMPGSMLSLDDAFQICRSLMLDESKPEQERLRLWHAVSDAALSAGDVR